VALLRPFFYFFFASQDDNNRCFLSTWVQLLALIPGPVKAVVLLFPIDAEGEEKRKREDARIAKEGQPMLDKTIFWVKQTVSCFFLEKHMSVTRLSGIGFFSFFLLLDIKCMWDYRTCTFSGKCL